ncbi:DUF3083 family protein [Thalassomonas viridans]|uniref:DUF3083 family protein n=1 Tax=Thalassomonas viridans TaxID=137584 RepID=A0AAE9Z537_9GAMM|nr:DUF3083 family protein [Thalassomonas viridans]WDE06214.1 DUF3083 family protein [Thalassomonas viridans]
MSIIRKRSASHKAYIPANARDNQYIMAEFPLSDELINKFPREKVSGQQPPYLHFYQTLSELFFKLSSELEITNSLFIANDKLARVRYSQEMHQWQTNQQILFYYNPSYHELQKSFFDPNVRATKITLLFLSTGDDIRYNAARFHAKIGLLLGQLKQALAIEDLHFRLRDHQHLTYDLNARKKAVINSQAHKLRPIPVRYASQNVTIDNDVSAMTYAVVNIPVSNKLLKQAEIDHNSADPYNPLYTLIADTFTLVTKQYNLNNGALIANGLVPIVRQSEEETFRRSGELQVLGVNPESPPFGIVCKWDARELVDNIQLVFIATKNDLGDYGYGRFLNQIEQAVRLMAFELALAPEKDEVIVRFHQHIAYNC